MTNNAYIEYTSNPDITKHLESLKTRLGFARFKLRNGWKNNTLLDVESFWKEKQRQMVDSLPTPRFTQRDILDNRTLHPHYHYHHQSLLSSSFINKQKRRHSHQQQKKLNHHYHNKKAKLIRSHSTPITIEHNTFNHHQLIHRQHSNQLSSNPHEEEEEVDFFSSSSSSSSTSTPSPSSSPQRKRKRITHIPLSPPIDNVITNKTIDHQKETSLSFNNNNNKIETPSSPPSSQQKHQEEEEEEEQSLVSSLDCLSYAAEKITKSFLYHQQVNNKNKNQEDDHSSSITAAAEAMMMFGNHTQNE